MKNCSVEKSVVSPENFGERVIGAFIANRHILPTSRRTYQNAIRQLTKYFYRQGIKVLTQTDIDFFIDSLTGKTQATIRLYVTVTKLFFSYLSKRGLYPNIAADVRLKMRKTRSHVKKSLTLVDAQKLFSAVKGENEIARRDKAILALALTTGLRTCEISRADIGDIEKVNEQFFLSVQGKGRVSKDAQVKLPIEVYSLIQEYLVVRTDNSVALFVSTSNHNRAVRLSAAGIGKLMKRYLIVAGLGKFSAHATRHFAATQALKNGVDIREVSEMLRHSSLSVTMIYAHDLSIEARRAENEISRMLFSQA